MRRTVRPRGLDRLRRGAQHDDGDRLKTSTEGDVRPVILDVTDPAAIDRVADELGRELAGRGLDGLVNNAGIVVGGPIETLTDEDWHRQFDVNVFGLVNLTRAVFPLVATARGRFVNVGSMNGRYAVALMGPYAASKHAVEAVSEALRFEVAGTGMLRAPCPCSRTSRPRGPGTARGLRASCPRPRPLPRRHGRRRGRRHHTSPRRAATGTPCAPPWGPSAVPVARLRSRAACPPSRATDRGSDDLPSGGRSALRGLAEERRIGSESGGRWDRRPA